MKHQFLVAGIKESKGLQWARQQTRQALVSLSTLLVVSEIFVVKPRTNLKKNKVQRMLRLKQGAPCNVGFYDFIDSGTKEIKQ